MARMITTQALSAVLYVHGQGIIHRDLKLENFLVFDASEESPVIRLADFGAAERAASIQATPTHCPGTIRYMSPEMHSLQEYTNQTDVWSLGTTIYTIMVRWRPVNVIGRLTGRRRAKVMREIKKGRVGFPESRWTDHKPAKLFVERILVVDPTARPSVEQIMGDPWLKKKTKGEDGTPSQRADPGAAATPHVDDADAPDANSH